MLKTAWNAIKLGSVGTVACYGIGAAFTTATGGAGAIVLAGATKTLSATGQAATWVASFAPAPAAA